MHTRRQTQKYGSVVHNEAQKAAHAGAVLFLIGVERERRVGVPIALAVYRVASA